MQSQKIIFVVCFSILPSWAHFIPKIVPPVTDEGLPEGPLILTPYIKSNRIEEGRQAAHVSPPLRGNIDSYSGFFTVDSTYNSNMFFWFFPAEIAPSEAPVVVWLQGGPGSSSLYGLFAENGPYSINERGTLEMREIYWSRALNVIYIDNPVGTGFSFTENDAGYATNETSVGMNLYRTLVQFFQLFPEYRENRVFLTGESYAGKYIPAAAYMIHKNNPTAAVKINLEGIAIGNGWCDPENQMNYGDYMYQLGLIDEKTRESFAEMQNMAVALIRNGLFRNAATLKNNILEIFTQVTGMENVYNYQKGTNLGKDDDLIENLMQTNEIRRSLHVGNAKYSSSDNTVHEKLRTDEMQSIRPCLQELMNNYRVLLYSGQLDVIVAYPLTMNMIQALDWKGKSDYDKATRQQWITSKGDLAGYFKTAGNFTEVLVRNAGHMVPSDQPEWALDLIKRFTISKEF